MITEIYERLHLDITEFDSEDVITTSLDPFEMAVIDPSVMHWLQKANH